MQRSETSSRPALEDEGKSGESERTVGRTGNSVGDVERLEKNSLDQMRCPATIYRLALRPWRGPTEKSRM